jgi:hypothetical protein
MFEGRIDWHGKDPEVIKLTANGQRMVQLRVTGWSLLHPGRLPFEMAFVLSDVDEARAWLEEK